MAKPGTRQQLVEYALRQLGAPVLEINIADEQIDDILDDTIQLFNERHYDGVVRTYLKYQFTKEDIDRGKSHPYTNPGVSTSTGIYPGATGASSLYPGDVPVNQRFIENSNYIQVPDHIIGVDSVIVPDAATGGSGFYPFLGGLGPDAAYPLDGGFGFLGGMGWWGGADMISYYISQMWLSTYNYLFNPSAMIRYNLRQDRLYLDINWNRLRAGQYIVIECYRALDPEDFCKIYNDRWVKMYLTARLKKQWGQNLIKFRGTKMPGGLEMNGREIYDDAVRELEEIKNDMLSTYELPPLDDVG